MLFPFFYWSQTPMTPVIHWENLLWGNVPNILDDTPLSLSVDASTEVRSHQLGTRATCLRSEEANTQGHFLRWNEMHPFALPLNVGRPRDQTKGSPHLQYLNSEDAFCIWLPGTIIWSLILLLITVGFVLFSHCFKGGCHLPHWETKLLKGRDCAVHFFWTPGGF